MYPWPDLLARYNLLLSQTLNFSNSLAAAVPPQPGSRPSDASVERIFEKLALHPKKALEDPQFHAEVAPFIRHNQTYDILKKESTTVSGLCDHLETRGSVGVLSGLPSARMKSRKTTYEDVLQECAEIGGSHERRVERGRLVVAQILEKTDKYEWKERVLVEQPEPDELGFDPRYVLSAGAGAVSAAPEDHIDEEGEFGDDMDDDEGINGNMEQDDGPLTEGEGAEMSEAPEQPPLALDPALQAMWQG